MWWCLIAHRVVAWLQWLHQHRHCSHHQKRWLHLVVILLCLKRSCLRGLKLEEAESMLGLIQWEIPHLLEKNPQLKKKSKTLGLYVSASFLKWLLFYISNSHGVISLYHCFICFLIVWTIASSSISVEKVRADNICFQRETNCDVSGLWWYSLTDCWGSRSSIYVERGLFSFCNKLLKFMHFVFGWVLVNFLMLFNFLSCLFV